MPERIRIQLSGRSYALLRTDRHCNTACIFAHGFYGHSEKTWLQFQTLGDSVGETGTFAWWRDSDLFFYSYDSVDAQIWPNASDLLSFVSNVFPVPNWASLGGSSEEPGSYKHLVLVGHSEGAVLIRAAIIERIQSHGPLTPGKKVTSITTDPLLSACLCLFAPALYGALVTGWKGTILKLPFLGDLVESCLSRSPAYQQLKADSTVLEDIRCKTEALAQHLPNVCALRARNLCPRNDEYAAIGNLITDYNTEYEVGQSHTSICKPSRSYLRPLAFVKHDEHRRAA
jgi:hypothetical protein